MIKYKYFLMIIKVKYRNCIGALGEDRGVSETIGKGTILQVDQLFEP